MRTRYTIKIIETSTLKSIGSDQWFPNTYEKRQCQIRNVEIGNVTPFVLREPETENFESLCDE